MLSGAQTGQPLALPRQIMTLTDHCVWTVAQIIDVGCPTSFTAFWRTILLPGVRRTLLSASALSASVLDLIAQCTTKVSTPQEL
eukprot:scaffold93030_cov19-Tisochrysis_lutea.AAC.1